MAVFHILDGNDGSQIRVDEVDFRVDDLDVVADVDAVQRLPEERILVGDLASTDNNLFVFVVAPPAT
jgi:hypothetical protein